MLKIFQFFSIFPKIYFNIKKSQISQNVKVLLIDNYSSPMELRQILQCK